jgi:molybdopterin-guanine dinucleotide biosynthesis protein A
MGSDKATLTVAGEPLWARQIALLQELRPEAIWISARTPPSWLPSNARVVLDVPPSRGPLSGIAAGLARLQSSHLLVVAVDLPRMTGRHLRKLLKMAEPGCGVIPSNQDQLEPLAAVYPKEAAGLAQSALALEDLSLQGFSTKLLQQHLLRKYPLNSKELPLYFNANTPEDLLA